MEDLAKFVSYKPDMTYNFKNQPAIFIYSLQTENQS